MKPMEDAAREVLAAVDLKAPLDAILLMKRSGVHLASWSRDTLPVDVATVMSAAAMGSIDTLLESLGRTSPRLISVQADGQRLLFAKAEPQVALVLIANQSMAEAVLRREAQRLLRAFARRRLERGERDSEDLAASRMRKLSEPLALGR